MTRFFSALRHPLFLAAIGLLLLAVLVWWVGPLLSFGDRHPLDGTGERMVVLAVLVAIFALVAASGLAPTAHQPAPGAGLAGSSSVEREAQALQQRFSGALKVLGERAPKRQGVVAQAWPVPLRAALVHVHRLAGVWQDHGAAQRRAHFPARRKDGPGFGARRGRDAQLRMVVRRRRGADRHRGPLHLAGLGCGDRRCRLGNFPRVVAQIAAAPADQRRADDDQHRGPAAADPGHQGVCAETARPAGLHAARGRFMSWSRRAI